MTTTLDGSLAPEQLSPSGDVNADYCLVDVRTPAEFRESSIPGSVNLPLGDLKRWAPELSQLANERPVALICRTGRRAKEAHKKLETANCRLHVLEGGVVAWDRAGMPLERAVGGGSAMSIERQVRVAAGVLTLVGVTLGLFVHPGFFGLAAFVGAGQVFTGLTDTCVMGMMLAKMPWNRGASCALDHGR